MPLAKKEGLWHSYALNQSTGSHTYEPCRSTLITISSSSARRNTTATVILAIRQLSDRCIRAKQGSTALYDDASLFATAAMRRQSLAGFLVESSWTDDTALS
jgi:hypothetical protein